MLEWQSACGSAMASDFQDGGTHVAGVPALDVDPTDSRKRPLEGAVEMGNSKRSNFGGEGGPEDGQLLLKVLIPSYAAGSIIGKGGQTIVQLQKETGATIKLSKSNDFYPGTTERIVVITGSEDSLKSVHKFLMEKISQAPQPPAKSPSEQNANNNRAKQVKIVVPNSTAGLIIGKGGATIKFIMEQTGSRVQISQKATNGINLPERVITITGEPEQNDKACAFIVNKIVEDPQSGSCPNISYATYTGPVANANPTGSPYASPMSPLQNGSASPTALAAQSLSNLGFSLGAAGLGPVGQADAAAAHITAALNTLATYGYSNITGGLGVSLGGGAATLPTAVGVTNGASPPATLLTNYSSNGTATNGVRESSGFNGTSSAANGYNIGALGNANAAAFGAGSLGALGAFSGAAGLLGLANTEKLLDGSKNVVELEVPENLVGAILGKGGKTLVEFQEYSGARIQISKKGEFTPGTNNRKVTITGTPAATQTAQYLVRARIAQEEAMRAKKQQQK
ncbi:RNA-binding protein Nova-1-like isoform X1 [Branchiostoma floridae]|uniref:Neuro-oncological ventral antigen n=1 Tax=Branchiostoma floridae TaxID=7739 RepID=F2YLF7_BRAFL|nr:RNA-binding protein Nova-1-like isoform X1 [Branchiostoma floridae]ADZ57231.1 neuro-oncological ventral antigen [Branchiostoma floridae]